MATSDIIIEHNDSLANKALFEKCWQAAAETYHQKEVNEVQSGTSKLGNKYPIDAKTFIYLVCNLLKSQ